MSHSFEIAPSLLAADLSRLGEEITALDAAGADLFHFDIMDGVFVPNISFGFPVIKSVRKYTKKPFNAHLMIDNADRYLEDFARVGCNAVSVHVEACTHLHRTVTRIRELEMKPGVAINPGTSLASLDTILGYVDYVLIMSVNPGFGGQGFIPGAADRVRELKKKIGDRKIRIEIDGGIKEQNIQEVIQAGVDIAVIGTGLLGASDYKAAIQKLRTLGGKK